MSRMAGGPRPPECNDRPCVLQGGAAIKMSSSRAESLRIQQP